MSTFKRALMAVGLLLASVSAGSAATAVCWDEIAGEIGTTFLLSVDEAGAAAVVRSFDPPGGLAAFVDPSFQPELATELLHYYSTGLEGFNSPGTSFFLVVSPEATDNLKFPYLIVFDWTTNSFGFAGVPFLAEPENLLMAWTDFECLRLE